MKRFEYQQVDYRQYPSPEELNEEGVDGWDAIFIYEFERNYYDIDLESYYRQKIYRVTFKKEIV